MDEAQFFKRWLRYNIKVNEAIFSDLNYVMLDHFNKIYCPIRNLYYPRSNGAFMRTAQIMTFALVF